MTGHLNGTNGASSSMKTRSEATRLQLAASKRLADVGTKPRPKSREYTIATPNDPTNEQVLLGAMCVDDGVRARLVQRFKVKDFYAEEHQQLFRALQTIEAKGFDFSAATVMRYEPDLDERFLDTLLAARPRVPKNLDQYIENLTFDAQRAAVTSGPLADLIAAVQDLTTSPDEVRALAAKVGEAFPRPAMVDGAGPLAGLPILQSAAVVGRAAIEASAERPIVWAWQDLATDGQIVVVFGAPGSGKTTLVFLIAAARASLTPVSVLGRRVEPAPVGKYLVIVEGEHAENSATRKLSKSFDILDVDRDALDRVIMIARKEVRAGSPAWLEIVELFRRGLVSDLFVDSLARFANGDANTEQDQIAVFTAITSALDASPGASKPLAWMIGHSRKGDGGSTDDVSGSTQRAAQGDVILFVKATKNADGKVVSSCVTVAKLREEPDEWPTATEFAITRSADGWTIASGKHAATKVKVPDRIRALLRSDGEMSSAVIRTKLNLSGDSVGAALKTLRSMRLVTMRTVNKRGHEYPVYAAKDTLQETLDGKGTEA